MKIILYFLKNSMITLFKKKRQNKLYSQWCKQKFNQRAYTNTNRNFFWFYLFILVYVSFSNAIIVHAASGKSEVKIDVQLENSVVPSGQPFEFDIVASVEGEGEVQEPQLPNLNGLEVAGKNSSVSLQSQLTSTPQGMQFLKKRIQTYRYSLVASKQGNYTIPAIEVTVDGKVYKTNPISVKVNNQEAQKQGAQKKPKGRGKNSMIPQMPGMPNFPNPFDEDEEDSLLGQLLQQKQLQQQQQQQQQEEVPRRQLPNVNTNEAFFIAVELDKTSAYEGEQIFANWYIYTRGDLYQLDRTRFPSLKGFWKEDIEPAPALIYQNEIVNGVPFRKALLASYAIFPIKEGEAVVDEYKVRAQVALPSPGFGGFSFGKPFTYNRSSERIPIKVNPLPPGKPSGFSGAVGTYEITVRADQQQIQQWKPFVLRVRFEGEGNAKFIEQPAIEFPKSFDIFDTKSEAKFFKSGKSYKEFTIQLVPKESGAIVIPPIALSYFDTTTKQYVTRQSEPLNLTVIPGEKPTNYSSSRVQVDGQPKKEEQTLPELKTEWTPSSFGWLNGFQGFIVWGLLELSVIFVILGIYFYSSRDKTTEKDLRQWMVQREHKIQNYIQNKDIRNAGAESLNLIYRILGGVSDEGNSGLELFRLIEQMPPSLRRELGEDLIKMVERWQILAFAPEAAWGEWAQENKTQELYQQTHDALLKMLNNNLETPAS